MTGRCFHFENVNGAFVDRLCVVCLEDYGSLCVCLFSICSVNSFDGAQGNLTRLLEKNRRRFAELSQKSPRDLPPDQQRSKDIKRFFVRFLYLVDIFYTAENK